MKYDVVIPVRNGEGFIKRAILSVENQTYKPEKIIIVNDGSTDGTSQIVKLLARGNPSIDLIEIAHAGLSAARNLGINASKKDYIAFLDCDDFWTPSKMENQMKFFIENPDKFIVFSQCQINNELTKKTYQATTNHLAECTFSNVLTQRFRVIGSASSATVNKKIFEEIGMFDSNMKYGEDYDFWVRISRKFKIYGLDSSDVTITIRKGSMQSGDYVGLECFRNSFMYLRVWDKNIPESTIHLGDLPRLLWPEVRNSLFTHQKILLQFIQEFKHTYPHFYFNIFSGKKRALKIFLELVVGDLSRISRILLKK